MNKNLNFSEHTGLVWKFVGRMFWVGKRHGLDRDDLFQAGCIGLMKAIERFDASRELEFSTFAGAMIYGYIRKEIRDYGHTVKIPRGPRETALKIERRGLEDNHPDIISKLLDKPVIHVKRALQAMNVSTLSLDAKFNDMDVELKETIPHHQDLTYAITSDFISSLTDREQSILILRMQDKTQQEISKVIGISQAHICRTIQQIRKKYFEYSKEDVAS